MTDKNWNREEALEAYDAALQADPTRSASDPTLPLYQWVALHKLDELRAKYELGEKFALMLAIRVCARHGLVMPSWVADGYSEAFDAVNQARSMDWNEVFGNPYPKRTHQIPLKRKKKLMFHVFFDAIGILKTEPVQAVDSILYERLGEKYGIGKTLACEYCDEAEKITGTSLASVRAGK